MLKNDEVVLGLDDDRHHLEGGTDTVCTDLGAWIPTWPTGSFACEQGDPGTGGVDRVSTGNTTSGTKTLYTSDAADEVCIQADGASVYLQAEDSDLLYVNPSVTTITASCGSTSNDGLTNRSGLTNCTTTGGPTSCPFDTSGWPARP